MPSTAKPANVGFSHVVQLFAPRANPAYAPRTKKNSVYKFGKKIFWVLTMCAQILGVSRVRVGVSFNWFVLVLWTIMWRHLLNQCSYGRKIASSYT